MALIVCQKRNATQCNSWFGAFASKTPPSYESFSRWGGKGGLRRPHITKHFAGKSARATHQNDQRPPINGRYVPSLHPAKYSSCSGVSLSILMPIDSSFSRATRLSRSSGTL